jgi:hypothetical protein
MIRDIVQIFRPLGTQNTINKSTDSPTVLHRTKRRKFLFLGRDDRVGHFSTRRRPPSSRPSSGIVPAAVRRRTLPPRANLKSDAFCNFHFSLAPKHSQPLLGAASQTSFISRSESVLANCNPFSSQKFFAVDQLTLKFIA